MALDANTAVESPLQKFNLQIYKYSARTLSAGSTPSVASTYLIAADLASVTVTSDASPGSCVFTIPDDDTTVYQAAGSLAVPLIGEEIYIRATDINNDDYNTVFKGYVVNVSRTVGDDGAQFNVECVDMKARLTDDVVTKTYNEQLNNARKPNFSAKDALLHEEKWNVGEIIEDIMEVSASGQLFLFTYRPVCYFRYSDIDFTQASGVQDFIPETLVFDNTPVLEAIYKTISSAGTYRLVYNANTDKLVITQVSLEATHAGDMRRLYYAKQSSSDPNKDYTYDDVSDTDGTATGQVNVVQDNTTFRISDIATVIRATGGDIKWYGGHFRIDADNDATWTVPSASGYLYMSHHNWDGYPYEFPVNALTGYASGCYVIVGCPLYPSWDTTTGYGPYKIHIHTNKWVKMGRDTANTAGPSGYIDNSYVGSTENDGLTVADIGFVREPGLNAVEDRNTNTTNGYVFEAWFPWSGNCLYCGGSGAVVSASGWDASWFGDSRNDDGTMKRTALSAFSYNYDSNGLPTSHPVPWENTCPACRGMGVEPRFKITNILPEVVDLPPSHIAIENAASGVLAPANRTWNQQMSEVQYTYPPQVQLENEIDDGSTVQMAGMPNHSLADTTSLTGVAINIYTGNDKKVRRLFRTNININADCTIDYIRGNVIFKDKVGITCIRTLKPIVSIQGYLLRYDDLKVAYRGDSGRAKDQPTPGRAYWRHPRAWISCYFLREHFYNARPSTIHDSPADLTVGSKTYRLKFGILNNKPVYEIYEKNTDPLIEFNSRPVIAGVDLPNYLWQVSPWDAYANALPLTTDNEIGGSLITTYTDHSYYFPHGMMHVYEPVKANEKDSTSIDSDKIERMDSFPKAVSWVQRDDRYKLITHAIKELERRNDIQIAGSVVVRGNLYSLANGLGYVVLKHYANDDKYKACVVKMIHSFRGAFTTTLELSTEEFRLGEKTEKERDSARMIERKVDNLMFKHPNLTGPSRSGKRFDKNDSERIQKMLGEGIGLF